MAASIDYTGYWTGEIRGTNSGGIVVELEQDGTEIAGVATINEPMLGPYRFTVTGKAGDRLKLRLAPVIGRPHLQLGQVTVAARIQSDGELRGTWQSEIGTQGTFYARREPPLDNAPDSSDTGGSARTTHPVRILRRGSVVDSYVLEERLGRGYSGEVWRVKSTREIDGVELRGGSTAAMKFYFQSMFQGMEAIRIQREFGVAANAEHPNLAKVYDLMICPSRPFHSFMVMEYVPGVTLKQYLQSNQRMNGTVVADVARQLLEALEELHSLGAVHRDVKAANIMLMEESDGKGIRIKLVDLGIVAVKHEERFTAPSVFLGSKHSASLEQLLGEEIDERADIYGAGSVLFHCITGRPMYQGVGPEGAIVQRMLTNPEKLNSASNHEIAEEWIEFVNRCIEVRASDRPRSARECLDAVSRIART